MKKLIGLFTLLFVVTLGSAQVVGPPSPPFPSVAAVIDNKTDCDFYVTLHEMNTFCATGNVITIFVKANTTVTSIAPTGGYWYEIASVTQDMPADPTCFLERVQVPWTSCPSGYNASETDLSCDCGIVTATWTATPSAPGSPVLTIFN